MPSGDVNNAKTPEAKANPRTNIDTVVVRTAMGEGHVAAPGSGVGSW